MAIKQNINLTALFLTATLLFAPLRAQARQLHINVISINESINPGVEEFTQYAIRLSERDKAEFLVILLDTPGGLMSSMRAICRSILTSQIPVVVYVYPGGARAASAGVFITEAADLAAMAPGANIGAAHPVSGGGGDLSSTMNKKVMSDALALARSIAQKRGRNEQWFQDAVRKSVSASAQEAFKLNVIDLVADNLPSLLKKLDGWRLRRGDTTVVLKTSGAELRTILATPQQKILQIVGNPNLAYLLLMIGLAGLYFELSRPGAIIPGVVGGISLILALYGMETLPVDYAGFLIILLGLVFFILEVKIFSHGALSLAGVACLVIGSVMLFPNPADRVGLSVLLPTTAAVSVFFAAVARLALRARAAKPQTGQESMQGMIGKVVLEIDPVGKVFVNGELWNAQAEVRIDKGEMVEVVEVHNLKLKVKRIDGRK
ncbi:MAG: nodulation protein NfeD [Syntrophobacteraceae bacterium]|nr:nodulation protein NfeD [Syntrophobacteraceae bacterium]